MSEDSPHAELSLEGAQQSNSSGSGSGRPSAGGAPTPNPRSCVTCRRRKVKCDKKHPCSNCVRNKIECIFPGPGRAPRKSRKPPDAELLERLRRLEGVVSSLNAQVEEHEHEAAERETCGSTAESNCPYSNGKKNPNAKGDASVAVDTSVEDLESRFGRLVVEKGRSRYINNSFWASLNNEVEDLKSILIEPSDDEDDVQTPNSSNDTSSCHQGFIFGYSSTNVDMRALHPPEQQARQYWDAFRENVDTLMKVLHVPTFEPFFFKTVANLDTCSKGLEALLFVIYYGAVTSTTAEECLERWGEDRGTLLSRYRVGLEQGLARANFLYCDEIVVLQAFVTFLVLLRRNDDARKIWTLTGLVVRIAQTLGIHRDGSHFNLPPFEIEMRRRLWWQVCILDARSSEDHGCDPTIVEAQFDTKMPLNVNDTDLHPDMTEFPEERQGYTDMTFSLLRFEVATIFRRILYIPPGPNRCVDFFSGLTIEQKEKWITECHARMEEKYLMNMDMSIPICWVTATISRLIMSKMWLVVYHPHQRKDGGASLPQETKDRLFITSLENVEYSLLLETEARTMKWGWLFRTYVQWHAIAFLLSELCVRTKGEAVERAWRALESTAGRWWFPLNDASPHRKGQQGSLWKPLKKLLAKAKAARERELALERASLALRNGNPMYRSLVTAVDQMYPPPLSADQSDSDTLDRMLRPSAPKLGQSPLAQPSWPQSPAPVEAQISSTGDLLHRVAQEQQTDGAGVNGTEGAERTLKMNSNPGQEFRDLMNFGLDNVIGDVMEHMDYEDNEYDFNALHPMTYGPLPESRPNKLSTSTTAAPTTPAYDTARAINGAHGTFGDASLFGNVDFGGVVPDFPTNGDGQLNGTGQLTDSPNGDAGTMDWTQWDDMVTQYGLEGYNQNPSSNPASHQGLLHWF